MPRKAKHGMRLSEHIAADGAIVAHRCERGGPGGGDLSELRADADARAILSVEGAQHRDRYDVPAPDRIPIATGVAVVATSRGNEIRRQVSGDTKEIVAIVEWSAIDLMRAKRPRAAGI